ncbi:dual specificity protein phosphatase family protein [Tumidithrix elongata RA019]|uniref:Dual specificity protein phosphatase family protein n=1 Tax=Tumidithrix elongata BACA0141 TaxID=2716417 RepID=A0AAW9Q4A6_9CYAN|nr:dual specificity protein phosphatase family protein [Tumidithrix elongata RA019]
MEEKISDNLWWVIPNQVAGVRKPTAEEISLLKDAGIGAIVSVMDDSANLDLYEQLEMPFLWLPVKGGTSPSIAQIGSLRQFVEHQNNLGHGVAIHCTSGRRRTGTFLAAYLINLGKTYTEALEIVQNANPAVELREAQVEFLHEFFLQKQIAQGSELPKN